MKISIVIPAYNEEVNIEACIRAMQEEIARSRADAEIIVANNASTDATGERARSAGAFVVDEPRKGITFARAAGYAASSGELVANIDADSLMPQGWLTTVEKRFSDPSLLLLSGPYIYYDTPLYVRFFTRVFYIAGYVVNKVFGVLLGTESNVQGGNYVLRRSALEAIGGFDTSISFYGEDTDIGRRVSKLGKVVWTFALPMKTSGRRLMNEGLVKTGWTYAVNFFWITVFKRPYTKTYTDVRL